MFLVDQSPTLYNAMCQSFPIDRLPLCVYDNSASQQLPNQTRLLHAFVHTAPPVRLRAYNDRIDKTNLMGKQRERILGERDKRQALRGFLHSVGEPASFFEVSGPEHEQMKSVAQKRWSQNKKGENLPIQLALAIISNHGSRQ